MERAATGARIRDHDDSSCMNRFYSRETCNAMRLVGKTVASAEFFMLQATDLTKTVATDDLPQSLTERRQYEEAHRVIRVRTDC